MSCGYCESRDMTISYGHIKLHRKTGIMHPREQTITATAFKAKCLSLMNDLEDGRIDALIVTRRGKPAVRVLPVAKTSRLLPVYGFMKGTIIVHENVDLALPIVEMPVDWPTDPFAS